MAAIRIIAGLGNPGDRYAETRHNAGFHFLHRVARAHGGQFGKESRFHGELAQVYVGGERLHLLLPMTYMNRSGRAVAALMRYYKSTPEELLVVHDEIDLPPGVARLKSGGGHGGHNGLRDIFEHIGSQNFVRLRIGVGRPIAGQSGADRVLHRPTADETSLIDEAMAAALDVLPQVVAGDLTGAMNTLHTQTRPAASSE